jgi:hypothetical protein
LLAECLVTTSGRCTSNVQLARPYRDVKILDDYFARQASIIESSLPQQPIPTSPRAPAYVFVLMPFSEEWSPGVYDLIKRAVDSLRPEFDIFVERADDISRPGKITQQIIKAIHRVDVIVADITGNNANVMWELGFRPGSRQAACHSESGDQRDTLRPGTTGDRSARAARQWKATSGAPLN